MEAVCMKIIEMSIAASWLIVAVIVLRLFLGKAPKGFRYVLWALVAIRLVCPFSVESAFSLVPDVAVGGNDTIEPDMDVSAPGQATTITPGGNGTTQPEPDVIGPGNVQPDVDQNTSSGTVDTTPDKEDNVQADISTQSLLDVLVAALPWTWLTDGTILVIYMIISYWYLWNKVKVSVPIGDNVFICDEIRSPFILGIIRPRIYVPSHIEKEQMTYIVAHEKEHLRCFDYLWKPLGFAILAIHWFNPLVWVAYILMCRDLELACDERVIRNMNAIDKKSYSETLLACSSPRHYISACPVAFGEIGIKERIKRVLSYKKPTVWIIGIALIACVVIAVCFMTDPVTTEGEETTQDTESTETDSQEKTEQDTYTFQITLPDGVTIGEKLSDVGVDGWAIEKEGYNPLEKYPYGDENELYLSPGWVEHYEGELMHKDDGNVYIPKSHSYYYNYIEKEGWILCEVEFEAYDNSVYQDYEGVSNDDGLSYYWVLIFGGDYFAREVDAIFLNQDCFTEAEACEIGNSFVLEGGKEPEDTEDNHIANVSDLVPQKGYILYETTADLNHDDIEDYIQVVVNADSEDATLDSGEYGAYFSVFKGNQDGTYISDAIYVSDEYSSSHATNGTFILTEWYGRDYLMYSWLEESMGEAYYYYEVFYFETTGAKTVFSHNSVSFAISADWEQWETLPHRSDVVPYFKYQMSEWIENGIILFALDVSTPVFASTNEVTYPASQYYDLIWAREDEDDVVIPEDIGYKAAYKKLIQELLDKAGEYADSLQFSLVYFNEDDIPELVVGPILETSMYTYHEGVVYTLMEEWGYGAGGNPGYFYIPRKNVLFNSDADWAGAQNYLWFGKIGDQYQLESYYEEDLSYHYVIDLDGDGEVYPGESDGKIHYFYGDTEITEEEFYSYIIGGEYDVHGSVIPSNFIELIPAKTLAEILAELEK